MKAGLSLVELATEIQRQNESKRDFVAPSRRLSLQATPGGAGESPGVVLQGVNGGMRLRPIAHQQLASALGIPKPYYDRMLAQAPDLLATNANRWLKAAPPPGEKSENRLVRTLDNEVRAILSSSYRPLDNLDLAEAVLPQLQRLNARVESSQITESRMYLKAVTDRIHGTVKVGDVVQAGIVVSNSEVGQGSLRVEELDFRLVCLNGMISGQAIRKAHLGRRYNADAIDDAQEFFRDETRRANDRAFFLSVQDTVRGMFDQRKFDTRLNRYRAAAGLPIVDEVPEVVELAAKKFSLTEDESKSVLSHLIKGGDLTQWGLANAITRMAQDVDSYDRSTELEAIGGDVIRLDRSQWNTLAGVAA